MNYEEFLENYTPELQLIDAIDIIVHIFHPEKRKFYDLEKMWSDPTNNKEVTI